LKRSIRNPVLRNALFALAGAVSVFHILIVTVFLVDTIYILAVDLMVAMVLIFCMCPASKTSPKERLTVVDIFLAALAIWVGIYTITQFGQYIYRLGEPTILDIISGSVAIILALEATRRTSGPILPIITCLAILYCFLGNYAPGMLKIMPTHYGEPAKPVSVTGEATGFSAMEVHGIRLPYGSGGILKWTSCRRKNFI